MLDYIPGNEISIEESKQLQLGILQFLHEYCEEHSLKYYLAGGTLIGAIRHNGFIPWDDDIDVFMPRYDYEMFLSQFKCNDRFALVTIKDNKKFYLAEGKLIDRRTELKEYVHSSCTLGIGIDIIPLDNMSNDKRTAMNLFHKVLRYRNALDIKLMRLNKSRAIYKNIVLLFGKILLCCIPQHFLVKRVDALARTYEAKEMTDFVAAATMAIYGDNEVMPRDIFQGRLLHEFEKHFYYIPIGYDLFLRNLYGDYMKLPPVEKQVSHHSYKAYWRTK